MDGRKEGGKKETIKITRNFMDFKLRFDLYFLNWRHITGLPTKKT